MRLLQFSYAGSYRLGAELDQGIVDLTRAYAARLAYAGEPDPLALASAIIPYDSTQFFARGELALQQARDIIQEIRMTLSQGKEPSGPFMDKIFFQPEEIIWHPPVKPGKYLAIGLNYADHIRETGKELPEHPLLFNKLISSVIGPGQAIELPAVSRKIDFEAELAVVIGQRAKRVSRDQAWDIIAGYTIANDVSARDLQVGDGQWTRAKGLDSFGPIGPVIVTADEVPEPEQLPIRLWLNDQLMQDSHVSQMLFDIPSLIEYITQDITLYPGDLIATGTPPGVGTARTPPRYLQHGDQVVIEIEGIGRLINPVVSNVH